MPNIIEISDLQGAELDVFARLTEAQLKNKRQAEQGMFIAESPVVIGHALDAGCEPLAFLMDRRHIEGKAKDLLARCPTVPTYTAEASVLEMLTGFALSRGVLCALRRPALPSLETVLAGAKRVAVLEGIVDTTNIGALFRSAAALGMDAVLLSPSCGDPLYRRALRVSMGTVFQIPWARLGTRAQHWPAEGMAYLHKAGFHTVALALDERAIDIRDPKLKQAEKLALFLGTEGTGLLPQTIAACDDTACIPMSHGVDSLNVASAAAVAFWQVGNGA